MDQQYSTNIFSTFTKLLLISRRTSYSAPSISISDSYLSKGSTEITKTVTYVQCSYWVNSTIAKYLTKGILVELQGRIGVTGYIAKDGTAKGSLIFHVNTIKLHGKSKSNNQASVVPIGTAK